MARAHFRDNVLSQATGEEFVSPLGGATVHLYQVGTTTPIADTIYAGDTGAGTLANPLTADALGEVEFWLEEPQRLDLYVTAAGFAAQRVTVDVDVVASERGTFDVREYGAAGDGVTDDGPAINAALAAASAVGGGSVFAPDGTYLIDTQIVYPGSGIDLAGAGIGRTVLMDTTGAAQGAIYALDRSNISLREMTIQPQAVGGSGYGYYIEGGDVTPTTDILVENVHVDQLRADGSGGVIAAGDAGFERVTLRGVRATSPASSTGTIGLQVGGGTDAADDSYDLLIEGCTTEGFVTGIHNGQNGVWHNVRIANCRFADARKWGAYLYHYDQAQVVDCEFSGCDVGAFMDDDAGGQGGLVTGCLFRDNLTIGLYREEWAKGAMVGCSFQGNGYGFWMSSGQDVSVAGCTFYGNTRTGVLVDTTADITSLASSGPAQGAVYSITNVVHVQDVSFAGCTISGNAHDGIAVKGAQGGFVLSGCVIGRNGTADSPTPTNYADVRLTENTDAANNYRVTVVGCAIGNLAGASPADTGFTKWGIVSTSGDLSGVDVVGCRFEGVEIPLSVPTGLVTVVGCTFVGATSVSLVAGATWRANTISGGSLAAQAEINPGDLTVGGDFIVTGGAGARIDLLSGAFQGMRLGASTAVTVSNYNLAADANGALLVNALTGQTVGLRVANVDVMTIAAAVITAAQLLTTVASASGSAGFRLPHGAAPSSPVNGDLWTTTAGLFVRVNGATVGPLS